MADDVFRECCDIFPEIDRLFLREKIVEFLRPFLIPNLSRDIDLNAIALPQKFDWILFRQITIDMLLENGYERVSTMSFSCQSDTDPSTSSTLDEQSSDSRATSSQEPIVVNAIARPCQLARLSDNHSSDVLFMAQLNSNLQVEAKPEIVPAKIAPIEIDDLPIETSESTCTSPVRSRAYQEQSKILLSNEFVWFHRNVISTLFRECGNSYTRSRNLLQQIIKPYVGDIDLDSIDPLDPRIPVSHLTANERFIRYGNKNYNLLSNARSSHSLDITCPVLEAEINEISKTVIRKDLVPADRIVLPSFEDETSFIECQTCFDRISFESLIACGDGHLFCYECMVGYLNTIIEVGVRKGVLECMEDGCDAGFPRTSITARIPREMVEKLDERIENFNLNVSGITDVYRCPKCQNQFQLEPNQKVLVCVSCKHASCCLCQEPWNEAHIGKKCEEVEGKREVMIRKTYEEEMTNRLIRICPKCGTKMVKSEGCNKMNCCCGLTMCYLCRETNVPFDHYCQHIRDPSAPCPQCTKCSLNSDSEKHDKKLIDRLHAEAQRKIAEERISRLSEVMKNRQESPNTINERKRSFPCHNTLMKGVSKQNKRMDSLN